MTDCLIVDDSRTIRRITNGIMTGFGFGCREAENGQLACDSCSEAMPDVIILDWNMPVMNGLEFITKLRSMDGGLAPKVVFCTTESEFDYIEKAMAAGADEYIMKPFDGEIVRSKLEQLGLLDEVA